MAIPATSLQRWLQHPQRLPWRRLLFRIHTWCALIAGLYIFFISITGSVLVYRNELYVWFSPDAPHSVSILPVLNDDELTERAQFAWPEHTVEHIRRPGDSNAAVDIWLSREGRMRKRYFDPRTGEDAGSSSAIGYTAVTTLIDLHRQFLAGPTGRTVNGVGAVAVAVVALTGLIIWWPGIGRWRQSILVRRHVGWRRTVWDLHSMVGIWSWAATLVFALSGMYLCFPLAFHAASELIQPLTAENAGTRLLDDILYWLAFLHFGRINGIGLPCDGPGLCDQSVKAVWALFGITPAVMFVTGVTMWWNRDLRRKWRNRRPGGNIQATRDCSAHPIRS